MTGIGNSVPAAAEDLEAVFRLYKPKIFRFILASLRDKDAAETLTQDCFLRAYLSRDRFRGDCSLDTWLMQIAVNLVRITRGIAGCSSGGGLKRPGRVSKT